MQNLEQDQMRQLFQDAIEPLKPTEQTKDRMYAEIRHRAAQQQEQAKRQETPKLPWLRRWQTFAGAAGVAALACVAIVMGAVHERLPQSTGQLEVVSPGTTAAAATEPASETEIETKTETETETMLQTQQTTAMAVESSAAVSEVETTVQPAVTQAPKSAAAATEKQTAESKSWTETETRTEAAGTKAAETQPALVQTTVPQETAAPAAQTTATAVQTTVPAADTTPAETTTRHKLAQSSELEFLLNWDGLYYNSTFEITSPTRICSYLGCGTAADAEGTMQTVVIYVPEDWEQSQELIVQYVGDDSYYRFFLLK